MRLRYIDFIAAAIILSLTGCGSNAPAAAEQPVTESTVSISETTAPEISAAEEENTASAAETDAGIHSDITVGLEYDESSNTWSSTDPKMQKLVRIMKRECEKSTDVKGVDILASDDGVIFISGMNSTDIDGTKVDAYTVYEIGSVTKMFTATAVLQLCEQEKLSLDDKLGKFFPDYEKGADITVYQLLHMQSGIRREFLDDKHGLVEGDTNNEAFEEWKKYFRDGITDEELLAELFAAELDFEPGTKSEYSNANYDLLAMIIEQVTGESYADYIQKNIFDVCGMEHSSSMKTGDVNAVPEPVPEDMYAFDLYELTPTGYMNCPRTWRGCGDIHSCAADMVAFDRALIGGKLISEGSLAEMFNFDLGYGCGWKKMYMDDDLYYHSGATHFFLAYNSYFKTEQYGNVYLIQLHSSCTDAKKMGECVNNIRLALQ